MKIITTDALLHVPLGAVLGAAMVALALLPAHWAAAVAGGALLYFREVTQRQCAWHRCDFRRGWLLGGHWHKHVEWVAPAVILLAAAGVWEVVW